MRHKLMENMNTPYSIGKFITDKIKELYILSYGVGFEVIPYSFFDSSTSPETRTSILIRNFIPDSDLAFVISKSTLDRQVSMIDMFDQYDQKKESLGDKFVLNIVSCSKDHWGDFNIIDSKNNISFNDLNMEIYNYINSKLVSSALEANTLDFIF